MGGPIRSPAQTGRFGYISDERKNEKGGLSILDSGCCDNAIGPEFSSAFDGRNEEAGFPRRRMEGGGLDRIGSAQRRTFTQSETIQPKLGGLLLQIEGLGKSKDPGKEGTIIHNAFAIVSYDDKAKQIRWHAYTADGRYVDTELKPLQEKTVQWSIPTPGQNIRFTMNLNEKDQWLETGEFSPDGNKWMKFFEMKLQRVK